MKPLFDKPFRAVTDGAGFYVIAEVDEKTGRRVAELLNAGETPEGLAEVVSDALNLHAMPRLIAKARL